MSPCCKTTTTWVQNLKIGQEYRQYTVQLLRGIGCCCEEYEIFVNGKVHEQHHLSYNPCSPLCCPGGSYEWQQDGHHFLLMYNSMSWTNSFGGYRLFINGIDVNTGREFSAFWRRRGWQAVFAGLLMIFLGVAWALIFHYLIKSGETYIVGYSLVITGVIYIILGVIPLLRYRKSRQDGLPVMEYSVNTV
ncbi:predicted protein [Nematostella vectensis]|uniref:Uncharacterized protein n=1 Tax=Nematostella vectensis TaxID=45351 RepID=A7RH65_NEMVE|nr:uncharacterized protein LOC5521574 [Nematostella vectensis]EDO27281.1 predicted protein [Nematostella vectensis]EDO49168.1 predicted protein [Nematostella vectensis]|eukprot:XP_001619381.1 hypothetical protein NEMVEDRAFT_v1g248857 [Nematostella vectensis]